MNAKHEQVPNPWSDDEKYIAALDEERRLFAWCLITYGGISAEQANKIAEERYEYEPPEDRYRGMIFHDTAWHWAMIYLFGERYWEARPEFAEPSQEYLAQAGKR